MKKPKKARFSPEEEALVVEVAKLFVGITDNRLKIGQLVQQYLGQHGGVQYGDATLRRLASHRAIQATEQQLRRCLDLYRFDQAYGKEMTAKYPDLCKSAWYQLARIMRANLPAKKEKREIFHLALSATELGTTVDALSMRVSDRLKIAGKLRKRHAAGDAAGENSANEADTDGGAAARPAVGEIALDEFFKIKTMLRDLVSSAGKLPPEAHAQAVDLLESAAKQLADLAAQLRNTSSAKPTKVRAAVEVADAKLTMVERSPKGEFKLRFDVALAGGNETVVAIPTDVLRWAKTLGAVFEPGDEAGHWDLERNCRVTVKTVNGNKHVVDVLPIEEEEAA